MRMIKTAGALLAILTAPFLQPLTMSVAQSVDSADATPVDATLLQQGQKLYEVNCAQCHQPDGDGLSPHFPALAGNANLAELARIVGNIHDGKGAMPAFPNLGNDQIAAVATYIRNSWGNSFGGVDTAQVADLLGSRTEEASGSAPVSIWDGIYTEAQAERGAPVVSGTCAKCHGRALNGAGEADQPPSPSIARSGFLERWNGRTVESLFQYLKATMPLDNPGQLTDQQYADVIAKMLSVSKVPPGTNELPSDPKALADFVIGDKAE